MAGPRNIAMTSEDMEAMWDELSTVPAVFTLEVPEVLSDERKKIIKWALEKEAETLEQSAEKYAQVDEELLQTLNLLTWLEFKIGSKEKALEWNDKALALTNNKERFSLGNRAHLMWCRRDLEQTRSCLDSLAKVKANGSSGEDLAFVKANQAYCYLRLGGRENLIQAVTLYEKALKIKPDSYLWCLQAGIANKLLSHINMQKKNMHVDADGRKEMEKIAKGYFGRVVDGSKNPRLCAHAYSLKAQLVSPDKNAVTDLCDKSLKKFPNDFVVMLNCAKALYSIGECHQALKILEEIPDERSSTESLKVRGDCLQKMGKNNWRESEREKLYKEAECCYRDALLKNPLNLRAQFSLAKLLSTQDKYREALLEFRNFFNTVRYIGETSYALLQIDAYEQAALCQLKLCHDPDYIRELSHPVTEELLKKHAQSMLLKALEIRFNILPSEKFKQYLEEHLNTPVDSREARDLPEALKLLSRVYRLVKEKEKNHQVLKDFRDLRTQDSKAIKLALKSYTRVESYDEAYDFLQMSIVQLEPCSFDWDLFTEVRLNAAWKRLGQLTSQTAAARIFKDQFDNHRQQDRYSNPPTQPSEGGEVTTERLDVLIIYDDSRDRSKGESELTNICRKLQQTMADVFGLNVSHNMQSCCAGGPVAALQIKEMKKAEVLLVLIDEEPMDGYFSFLLNDLPNVMEQREDNPRPPRVLVAQTNDRVKVPSAVSSFPKVPFIDSTMVSFETLKQMCKRGEAISSSGDPELADDTARKCVEETLEQMCDRVEAISSSKDPELADDTARKCVEDIMVFFCCLISTDWPLSQTVAV